MFSFHFFGHPIENLRGGRVMKYGSYFVISFFVLNFFFGCVRAESFCFCSTILTSEPIRVGSFSETTTRSDSQFFVCYCLKPSLNWVLSSLITWDRSPIYPELSVFYFPAYCYCTFVWRRVYQISSRHSL